MPAAFNSARVSNRGRPITARMAAGKEPDERLCTPLDRVAARLAQPLATGDIGVDFGSGERFEGDDSIGQPRADATVGSDNANRRQCAVPPAR